MDKSTRAILDDLRSPDGERRSQALSAIIVATDTPVDWAYEVWDEAVANLRHPDNHQRAIAAQLLCGLAKSDPERRMLRDLDALLVVTRDARFVTARHALQSIWKVGAASAELRQRLVARLSERFQGCDMEKNGTLVRYDIIESLRKVYDATYDAQVREAALALIATEADLKYRKKYAALWRPARA